MVEQISPGAWRSTLLGNVFDSREAAEFYDRQEQAKQVAAAERSAEEYLDSLPASALRDIEQVFRRNMDLSSQPVQDFTEVEFNRFVLNHPRFIPSEENCRRLGSYLVGQNLYAPYSNTQLSQAYDALTRLGHLDLQPLERR